MLFRETVAVYCDNHTEHTNTLYGQNAEFSPYLTGNTLRLCYKAQLVNTVYCENHTEDTNALYGLNAEVFHVIMGGTYNNDSFKQLIFYFHSPLNSWYVDVAEACFLLLRSSIEPLCLIPEERFSLRNETSAFEFTLIPSKKDK
jgi:hypothetical protein